MRPRPPGWTPERGRPYPILFVILLVELVILLAIVRHP